MGHHRYTSANLQDERRRPPCMAGKHSHSHRQRPQTKPDRRSASLESRRQGVIGTPLTLFQRPAKSLRWWLWHGRARVAETYLKGLMYDCARLAEEPLAVRAAAARAQARCETLYTYLANNVESLVDYGRRYRNGLPISSSRAEGSVDDIANARMGKRRRMRWSPKGAHRVAVTRAAVLDSRLTVANRKRAA